MKLNALVIFLFSAFIVSAQDGVILFFEGFEDTNFEARGWYDHLQGVITDAEHIEGSNYSLELKFLEGGTQPVGGTPGRHLFDETEEVCLSYYVKYSLSYLGSGQPYHPHEFHFLTNMDNIWVGPAFTHLTTYIEHNSGFPLLGIQDGENIDQERVYKNLVGITESRAIAGCNGSTDGYPDDCYNVNGLYVNGKAWKSNIQCFSNNEGKYYKNDWHKVEAYFKLNSIVDGIGMADGVVKYWFDGELVIDHEDVAFRTGEYPDMKFNQFLIAPYFGDGSPVEQTMWIDDLMVSTKRIVSSVSQKESATERTIFPVPANDYISIPVCTSSKNNIEARVYNSFSEQVLSFKIENRTDDFRLNVSELPPGLYFIMLNNKVQKFIITR